MRIGLEVSNRQVLRQEDRAVSRCEGLCGSGVVISDKDKSWATGEGYVGVGSN